MEQTLIAILGLALAAPAAATEWAPAEGAELVGTVAPEWSGLRWIDGGPLSLARLRGKVVLVRFWSDGCPYCEKTAPALRALDERYRKRGLVVVGIHHPKPPGASDVQVVARAARALGFTFPVATDPEWKTIGAYGVPSRFTRFTSVAFLIDRRGVVRWVHDGGEFHPGGGEGHERCNAAFDSLGAAIERLLAVR
jgi:peroxiredoxin